MRTAMSWMVSMLLLAAPARADRGFIPHKPDVKIFEPTQRAMIAWDGKEEILLLTTDVRASEKTVVLEILPCPSEPRVTKGSLDTFRRATRVINRHLHQPRISARSRSRGGGPPSGPAGEITFHKKIGAHDISVAHVLSGDGFVSWVEKALAKEGVKNPEVPAWARKAVEEYIREGFDWFVFDSIELGPRLRSAVPIRYRFPTGRLFYPLKITKVAGPTTVDLIVLTPKLLSRFDGIPASRIGLPHQPFAIGKQELEHIDKEMATLLGHQEGMKLRIWKIHDGGRGFERDLIAH